jgi:aspartate kinase
MKIVMKFGGTSVADIDKIKNVAKIIANQRETADVAVVVSAMGKTTNALTNLAHQITDKPNLRELDALLSTGECTSVALLAMALNAIGCPARSYNAWQMGIWTDEKFGDANIKYITAPIWQDWSKGTIPIITGFQGITYNKDITTLGREGSDTSAVAIAAAIGANYCDIYTDVDGVYDADPNVVKDAKKLDFVSYDDMLKMANNGAKVLHPRSVMTAQKHNIPVRVRGTFTPNDIGTLVANSRQR